MSRIPHPPTKPVDKRHKPNGNENGKLTEAHLKCGSLRGKKGHWSQELRCWMFLKPDVDFTEAEQRYIEQQNQFALSLKKTLKSEV